MAGVRFGGVNGIKVVSTSRAESGGTLRSLTDTSVSNPQDGHLLVYNGTTQLWTSQATLGANTDLDGGSF